MNRKHRFERRGRPSSALPAALFLALAAMAAAVASQTDGDRRIERRIQVVFSDEDGVTEERIWVGDGSEGEPLLVTGDGGEMIVHAPFLHGRAYLGVQLLDITPELRRHFGAAPEVGVLVSGVAADSPAAAAGIEVGDVLTAIDREQVARAGQVMRKIGGREDGETVALGLIRERRSLTVEATLAERPRSQVDLAPIFRAPGDGERRVLRLPHRIIEIEEGDLDEAFSELHERLASPEWRQMLEETASRRQTLENRIRELEERLREMEKRLEKDSD